VEQLREAQRERDALKVQTKKLLAENDEIRSKMEATLVQREHDRLEHITHSKQLQSQIEIIQARLDEVFVHLIEFELPLESFYVERILIQVNPGREEI
jgi:seryl-tRNA synthetase